MTAAYNPRGDWARDDREPPSAEIALGTVFDTPFETGCVALEAPDAYGSFDALDHERVICRFNTAMVRDVR